MKTITSLIRKSSTEYLTAFIFAFAMCTTLTGTSVKASPITIDLIGTVIGTFDNNTGGFVDGNFKNTVGNGTLTFNDDFITGNGFEFQSAAQGLALTFDIFGQSFTEANADFSPTAPLLSTLNGNFQALDFFVSEGAPNPIDFNDPGIFAFVVLNNGVNGSFIFDNATGAISGLNFDIVVFENAVAAVPVPAALPLFGTGLAIMGFLGWRRKRKAAA